jgi:hypothetical protein
MKSKRKQKKWNGRLESGLFFGQTERETSPFGLTQDQRRLASVQNNAGWFNIQGEKIGTGDLSMVDLDSITTQIIDGEFFVVLSEFDTVWGMPAGMSSSMPGTDYVLTNGSWFVIGGYLFRVRNSVSSVSGKSLDGVSYIELPRGEFFKRIGYDPRLKAFVSAAKKIEEKKEEAVKADEDAFNALFNKFISGAAPPTQAKQAASPSVVIGGTPIGPGVMKPKVKKKIKRSVP